MSDEGRHAEFIELKHSYLKAAAFDNAYARRADYYALLDRWLQTGFTTLTVFTSAGAFVAFTENAPSDAVKLTTLILALVSAGLSALRQGLSWGSLSETYRRQGSEWTRQRNKSSSLITHLLAGERIERNALVKLSEIGESLVGSNPPISHDLYTECKALKEKEFNRDYKFVTAEAPST